MTAMEELQLPVPELVDVIPVEQADAILAVARQELSDLTHQVEAARLAADAAERQVLAQGADAALVGRAAEQVQRFIDERRQATDEELRVLLDAASAQAKSRIEEARAEADRITGDARMLASGPPPAAPAAPRVVEVPAPIFPQHVFDPAPAPEPEPEPLPESEPDIEPTPAAVAAPTSVLGSPAFALPVGAASPFDPVAPPTLDHLPPPPGPSEPMWLPLTPPPPAVPTATIAAPTTSMAAPPAPDAPSAPGVPEPAVAPAAPAEPAKLRLGSVPVFALLQVLGLALVLVVLLVFVN